MLLNLEILRISWSSQNNDTQWVRVGREHENNRLSWGRIAEECKRRGLPFSKIVPGLGTGDRKKVNSRGLALRDTLGKNPDDTVVEGLAAREKQD